jgi:hypothetical protein
VGESLARDYSYWRFFEFSWNFVTIGWGRWLLLFKMESELPISAFAIFAAGVDHPECVAFDRSGDL